MKPIYLVAICLAVTVAIFFGVRGLILSDNKYPVKHFTEVERTTDKFGRTPAGSPEVFQVQISPALAWKKGDSGSVTWIVIGFVIVALTAVYAALAHLFIIKGNIHYAFVGMALTLACWLAAYSSRFVSNYVELSKTEYELVKDNPQALEKLFDKPLLK